MMFGWLGVLVAGAALLSPPADTGTYYLAREIVVWGTRSLDQAHRLPLSYLQVAAASPADLAGWPGLAIRDYLGIAGLSLRGSAVEELQVLLEGFPVKPAQTGYLDLHLFPRGFWQAVETVANPTSAYFGADAMAGVVNLQLDFRPRVALWAGSLGDHGLVAHHTLPLAENSLVQVSLGWHQGPEGFRASDAFGRPLEIRNLGSRRRAAAVRWFHNSLELLALWSGRSGGLPQIPNFSPHPDSLDQTLALLGIRWGGLQGSWVLHDTRYRPVALPPARHREGTLDLRYRRGLWELRGTYARLHSTTVGFRERLAAQAALRDTLHWGPALALLALRGYVSTSIRRPVWTASAGLQVPAGLYARLSNGFREPTFNELYWPQDPFARGNPALRPEKAWEAEVGWKHGRGARHLRVALFHRQVRDRIQWVPDAGGRYRPVNLSRAVLEGAEALVRTKIGPFTLEGAVSGFWRLQAPTHLVYVPWAQGRFALALGPVTAVYRWIGPRWERPTGPKTLDPVHLLDLRCRLPLGPVHLHLEGRNLLDQRYEWIRGIPQPGRTGIAEITWNGTVPGFLHRLFSRNHKTKEVFDEACAGCPCGVADAARPLRVYPRDQ